MLFKAIIGKVIQNLLLSLFLAQSLNYQGFEYKVETRLEVNARLVFQ
jgi:hypothetical protein